VALQIGFVKMTGAPLNSVQLVPAEVLSQVAQQLGEAAPRIASVRALYHRRRRTLFDHQRAALAVLGFRDLPEHGERGLVAFLRREAVDELTVEALAERARVWLFEQRYVIPARRRIDSLARAARHYRDRALIARVERSVGAELRAEWLVRLTEVADPQSGLTRLDWLREGPFSKKPHGLADQVAKVAFLRSLGADRLQLELSPAALEHYARPMLYRKAAALARTRSARRPLELACFLRLQLLRLTDTALDLLDHRIADLWRGARARVEERQRELLRRCYRRLVRDLSEVVADAESSAPALRERLGALLAPFVADQAPTRAAAIRAELSHQKASLDAILDAARTVGLTLPQGHPLAQALVTLEPLAATGTKTLPAGIGQPFGPSWAPLIEQSDREAALACYRAATVMLLKRSLRNGTASVDHSLNHRAPSDRLMPAPEWARERGRLVQVLTGGLSVQAYLSARCSRPARRSTAG
jgi:hypothetical protein